MASRDYLLVGLGNPGSKYDRTRHNIGFMALDFLMASYSAPALKNKMQGSFARFRSPQAGLLFLQPQTYMNRSGESVVQFLEYFQIDPGKMLVIHDDIDLPFGRIKVVAKGGAGGHNGIRSIIQHVGQQNFSRIKIGVGRPESHRDNGGQPVDKFVLSRFSNKEQVVLDDIFTRVREAVELFVDQGIVSCMNGINGHPPIPCD